MGNTKHTDMVLLKNTKHYHLCDSDFLPQVCFENVIEWEGEKNLLLSQLSKALLFKPHLLLSIAELQHVRML